MFNVTVLRMKDIVKYILSCTIIIVLIMTISKGLSSIKTKEKEAQISNISFESLLGCLDKILPTVAGVDENISEESEEKHKRDYLEEFLKTEISSMKGMDELEKQTQTEKNVEEIKNEKEQEKNNINLASTQNITTEVVTPNPITESFNVQYGKVKIKNQTSYTLTEEMMKPDITIDNKNILIFQTHSCESYTSSEKYPYTPSGNFRSTDLNFTVTRVGTELENYLKQYNFNVIHDMSYHDYPAYNGSYTRSLTTVENILKTTSSDIIIDLHRDAIGSREDYAPTVKIGEDYCAQIMFVIRNK